MLTFVDGLERGFAATIEASTELDLRSAARPKVANVQGIHGSVDLVVSVLMFGAIVMLIIVMMLGTVVMLVIVVMLFIVVVLGTVGGLVVTVM